MLLKAPGGEATIADLTALQNNSSLLIHMEEQVPYQNKHISSFSLLHTYTTEQAKAYLGTNELPIMSCTLIPSHQIKYPVVPFDTELDCIPKRAMLIGAEDEDNVEEPTLVVECFVDEMVTGMDPFDKFRRNKDRLVKAVQKGWVKNADHLLVIDEAYQKPDALLLHGSGVCVDALYNNEVLCAVPQAQKKAIAVPVLCTQKGIQNGHLIKLAMYGAIDGLRQLRDDADYPVVYYHVVGAGTPNRLEYMGQGEKELTTLLLDALSLAQDSAKNGRTWRFERGAADFCEHDLGIDITKPLKTQSAYLALRSEFPTYQIQKNLPDRIK